MYPGHDYLFGGISMLLNHKEFKLTAPSRVQDVEHEAIKFKKKKKSLQNGMCELMWL